MNILIVDDDVELSNMLSHLLNEDGFGFKCVSNGMTGLELAISGEYDAVILDVMMPKMDGFTVLRTIRKTSNIPVIMLTAKGDEIDRIVGLEIGADDYLPKPFSSRELVARLRSLLRRSQNEFAGTTMSSGVVSQGELELCTQTRKVFLKREEVNLTSTEYSLLHLLIKQVGQMVSKEVLSKIVLDRVLKRYDRSIDMHMSNLRKKIMKYRSNVSIVTVRGRGYQLSIGKK